MKRKIILFIISLLSINLASAGTYGSGIYNNGLYSATIAEAVSLPLETVAIIAAVMALFLMIFGLFKIFIINKK